MIAVDLQSRLGPSSAVVLVLNFTITFLARPEL